MISAPDDVCEGNVAEPCNTTMGAQCCSLDLCTNIFSSSPGTIVAVTGQATPIAFSVDGTQQTFNDLKAIVTSIGVQGQGGYQFMHAMRNYIYVYVFTERIGELVINGLAFPESCGPLGPQDYPAAGFTSVGSVNPCPDTFTGQTGLERVMEWYECNRITSRSEPISIALGGSSVPYEAFLLSVRADIANAETGIAQFSMRFNYVPNIIDDDAGCFATMNSIEDDYNEDDDED